MTRQADGDAVSWPVATPFREMEPAKLDAAYNNAAAFADSREFLDRWRLEGDKLRRSLCSYPDLAYGETDRERIDLYLAGDARPTLAFIHGGYWHMNSKEMFGFMVRGPLSVGYNVALIGYTLAPAATLDRMVDQVRRAVDWLRINIGCFRADPRRITVGGWSAGGHLAAMVMIGRQVERGISISGIFDLEPIRLSYLNKVLSLTEESARRNSPLEYVQGAGGHISVVVGGAELPEFRRQSAQFAAAWRSAGLSAEHVEVPQRHHFAVLEELARPGGCLLRLLRA